MMVHSVTSITKSLIIIVVTGVFTAATCTPPDRVPTERAAPADRSTAVDRRMASTQLMEVVQLIEGQPATRDGTGFRGAHLFRIAAMSAAPCAQGNIVCPAVLFFFYWCKLTFFFFSFTIIFP